MPLAWLTGNKFGGILQSPHILKIGRRGIWATEQKSVGTEASLFLTPLFPPESKVSENKNDTPILINQGRSRRAFLETEAQGGEPSAGSHFFLNASADSRRQS